MGRYTGPDKPLVVDLRTTSIYGLIGTLPDVSVERISVPSLFYLMFISLFCDVG